VSLRLGANLDADAIKEGDDVYFECSIRANPDAVRLHWTHEVSPPWAAPIRTRFILEPGAQYGPVGRDPRWGHDPAIGKPIKSFDLSFEFHTMR